jgi:hypothetical protein
MANTAVSSKLNHYKQNHSDKKERDLNLSTAMQNYIDPRILYNFCSRNEVPVDKIISRSMYMQQEWSFDQKYFDSY